MFSDKNNLLTFCEGPAISYPCPSAAGVYAKLGRPVSGEAGPGSQLIRPLIHLPAWSHKGHWQKKKSF